MSVSYGFLHVLWYFGGDEWTWLGGVIHFDPWKTGRADRVIAANKSETGNAVKKIVASKQVVCEINFENPQI